LRSVDVMENFGVFQILGFLCKRDGMPTADFIDYYENHHVPLILSLAPAPAVYKRHYLADTDSSNVGSIDFDVITELQWLCRKDFERWIEALGSAEAGERVATDEARFLDRSRTRSSVVMSYVTKSTDGSDF
jgi:EthD domain